MQIDVNFYSKLITFYTNLSKNVLAITPNFLQTNFTNMYSYLNTYNITLVDLSFLKNFTLSNNNILIFNNLTAFLNQTFNIFFFYLFVVVVLTFFLNLMVMSLKPLKMLIESEKELNNIDDFLIFFSLIQKLFFFIIGLFFFYIAYDFMLTWLYLTYFLVVFVLVILVPTTLLLEYGYYYLVYLRGSNKTLSFIYELILDYINIVSFFLRIGVQFMRILILLLTIHGYNELFLEYNNIFDFNFNINLQTSLVLVLVTLLHFVFEYGHILIIFAIQYIAFNVMVFWLFQFLFTMFNSTKMESFFFFKRV